MGPLEKTDITAIQQRYRDDVIGYAREFLQLTGADSDFHDFTIQLQESDFVPRQGASDALRAVLIAAEAAIRGQDERFEDLIERVTKRGLSARLALQLLPDDPRTYFWSRCAIEYTSLARKEVPGHRSSEAATDPESALVSAALVLSDELRFRREEIAEVLAGHPGSLRPDEQTLVDIVGSVRKLVAGHAPDNRGVVPRLDLMTALHAAYAFHRWVRMREIPMELPTEFLAAILQRMGITNLVDFDRFEEFVGTLRRSGTQEIRDILRDLKPHFRPSRNGDDGPRG